MAIVNISGTITSSFQTSGVLINAAQQAGDAILTFDLRPTTPEVIVQDNVTYSLLGWNINDVVCTVILIGPQGEIYRNEDFNNPDIVPATSRYMTTTVTLPLDPLTNYSNILTGNYTLKVMWYNSALDEYYNYLKTFQYIMEPPTIANTTVSGPYTGVLKSTDTTDYGLNVHQVIREHRIQYPDELAVPPADIVSSNAEIQVTPIYTNEWTIIISSFVEYRQTDLLRVFWEGEGTFTHCVYGGCIGSMYDAIEQMLATYTDELACNLITKEQYQQRLTIVNTAWHLLNEAYWSGDAEEADQQSYIIAEQVAYTGSGTCGGPTSELVTACPPWTGGGTGGTYTFQSGLTEAASVVTLGGTLLDETLIYGGGYDFGYQDVVGSESAGFQVGVNADPSFYRQDATSIGRMYVKATGIELDYVNVGTPALNKTYILNAGGLVEEADYSGDYTARTLVAKDYVDNLVGGLTAYTFDNGLTESGGDVTLGGSLNQETTIELQNDLIFEVDNAASLSSRTTFGLGSFTSTHYGDQGYDYEGGYGRLQATSGYVEMLVRASGVSNVFYGITLDRTNHRMRVRDDIDSKGLVYYNNYYAVGSLDDRWIPDWGAVKTYADSVSGVTTFTSLTDTPGSYSGFATYFVRVNAGGTALEFVAAAFVPATGGTFTGQVTIATTTDRPLIIQQIGAGSNPGTPEGGTNLIAFQDNDGDEQGYIGIDASGNVVLRSWITGAGVILQSDLEVNGDIIITGVVDGVDIAAWKTEYDTKSVNWDTAYGWGDHAGLYQPLDADLTSIAGLGFTSLAFLKKTAADTWALDTEIYATQSYVDSLALTYIYPPTTLNVVTSDGYTGTVTDVQDLDGDYIQVEEATGAPGFEIRFEYTSVTSFNNVFLYLYYPGGATHDVWIQLYNYNTLGWDTIGTFTDQSGFTIIDIPVALDDDYIDTGDAVLRLYHNASGNALHYIQVDYAVLRLLPQLGGGGGITDHGGLTGLGDDDHPQYALADGSRCTYYIPNGTKQSSVDAGTFGETSVDDDYLYVCVQTGTAGNAVWKRMAIAQTS